MTNREPWRVSTKNGLDSKQHWVHLRTTNIVESPFDMVRLRTNAARRFKRVENATAMIWKLLRVAEKTLATLKRIRTLTRGL